MLIHFLGLSFLFFLLDEYEYFVSILLNYVLLVLNVNIRIFLNLCTVCQLFLTINNNNNNWRNGVMRKVCAMRNQAFFWRNDFMTQLRNEGMTRHVSCVIMPVRCNIHFGAMA